MSRHFTTFQGSVNAAVESSIKEKIPDARVTVSGRDGHYEISVASQVFAGKSTLEKHRLVLGAIAHLMKGDDAPVHAVDKITTSVP